MFAATRVVEKGVDHKNKPSRSCARHFGRRFLIQIKQAILNILLNAIENSSSSGSITLSTEAKDGNVSIKVEDEGEGIQPTHRNRIFAPFFFSTKEGGLGLGLALAAEVVRLHHGHISFISEVGKGSSFVISLPLRP